jgi:peptidoglycan/xylan/chitin deacetylase (PgdA/CDA1 family)
VFAAVAVLAGFLLYLLRLDVLPGVPRAAGEPIRWVETDRRWVALTFDGAPDPTWTPVILRLLRAYGASATFFPTGMGLERQAALVRAMVAEGHEVGAAPLTPERLVGDDAEMRREVWAASVRLEAVTGVKALVFRPIGGGPTRALAAAAAVNGERLILWDVDARDTGRLPPAAVVARILRGLRRGAIVRLHEGRIAARALGLLLPRLRALGYRSVTVSQLLGGGVPQSATPGQPPAPPAV